MTTLRLPYLGKYIRDRYVEDERDPQKQAMIQENLERASREDREKVAFNPLTAIGQAGDSIAKEYPNTFGLPWRAGQALGRGGVNVVHGVGSGAVDVAKGVGSGAANLFEQGVKPWATNPSQAAASFGRGVSSLGGKVMGGAAQPAAAAPKPPAKPQTAPAASAAPKPPGKQPATPAAPKKP